MTEQTFTTESDPKDFTVPQVEAYLATADEAERTRVFGLETGEGGKDREGVKKAATEVPAPPAPEGLSTQAATFQEAAAQATEASGEAYEKGYFGHVPSKDGDHPVDLSVAGVVKAAAEAKAARDAQGA